jgi:peptidoglycan/LPS O-acetylase OafA/YrhL
MPPSSPNDQRLFGPDLIRATAIICVMLSHTIPGLTRFAIVGPIRGALGFIGVEIFFVLSGYLIGGILLRQMCEGALDSVLGLASFWKRRWFRTLPNYYLFLILFLLLGRCVDGTLPTDSWSFFWFGQALISPHPKFFTVAWSLAVEEWFYFSFPLLLWLMMKTFRGRMVSFWITVVFFLSFPPVMRAFATFDNGFEGLAKVTLFRLDSIMFGVILAFLHKHQPRYWSLLRRAWPLGVPGAIGVSWLICASNGMEFSFLCRAFFFSIVSLSLSLIFPRVVGISRPQGALSALVSRISIWSYSMYLCHTWLGQLFVTLFSYEGWSIHGANAVVLSALDWFATLTISALVYSYFEKPLMDFRERPLHWPIIPCRSH